MELKNAETQKLKMEDLENVSGGEKFYSAQYGGYVMCDNCGCTNFDDVGFVSEGPGEGHFEYKCTCCGQILHYRSDRGYY